ncbi:ABC transporter substrate-binding protein [Paenibacillus contaminans]|uniref:ABC transporter substrate-binding protein n=1 Tax=Paenibacillus contaminans TaxID=450362 RepID=A0A329MDG6_9BACL|nr:ABC transporter substrate-binding protein [Paenibacillus contaminans]RAV17718.1 ABC transporter substrate-binding protein [Paenibacillus contaminans]
MKKVLSGLLVAAMGGVLVTGCGSSDNKGASNSPTPAGTETASGDLREKELVKLDVAMMSTNKDDKEEVTKAINEITRKKLNVEVNLTFIAYGNYVQQTTMMLSSGKGVDLLPVYMTPLATMANNGQILPLTKLLDKYGKDLVKAIGPEYIESGRIGDDIYGITTGRDLAKAYGFEMRKDLADKYNIDYKNIKTLDQLEEALTTIHKNEPNIIPVVPSNGELVRNWGWDTLGDDITNLGVLMDFGKELKVVNLYETEFYKAFITRMNKWYKNGLIMKDAINNTENAGQMMKAGKAFGGFVNLKPGFDVQETRNNGIEIVTSEIVPAYKTTSDVQMATWAISNGTKNPDAAMKLLNLMYTDPELVNLMIYGIKDKHYVETGDAANGQKIIDYPKGLDGNNTGYRPSSGWLWPNQTIGHVWNGNPANYWEVQTEFNKTARPSAAYGFTFDSSRVRNQMTATTNVVAKYHKALMNGMLDPETTLPVFQKELKAAGIDDIIAAKQSDLDKWAATHKK